jgi:hypothetical protein
MRLIRFLTLSVALVIAVSSSVFGVHAQGTACYSLPPADCKILTAAEANVAQETSFNFDYDLALTLTMGSRVQSITAKGSGLFEIDPAALLAAESDLDTVLNGLKITLSMDGSLKSTGTGVDSNQKIQGNLIVIDGMMYVQSIDVWGNMSTWQSTSLSDVIARSQSTATNNPLNNVSDPATTRAVQDLFGDPKVTKAIASISKLKGFISLKRTTAAPALEGQRQIEFLYTYNIPTLIAAKEMYPVLSALMKAGGFTGQLTDAQMAQAAQMLNQALSGTTLKISRWVGSKDNLFHALTIDFVLKLDPRKLSVSSDLINCTFHFSVKQTKIGQPVDIQAPEMAE